MAESVKFEGEEAGAGYAAPALDLLAAAFLVGLALVVMVASFRLPVPGGVRTAPGLLPFLTAASLLLMALMLGATALKRRHQVAEPEIEPGAVSANAKTADAAQTRATLALMLTVGVYIAALQWLAFQTGFTVAGIYFSVSAFEPVTIVMLTAIIQSVWRGPIWITTLLSIVWTLVLSVVFQKAFNIPLPGSF